VLQQGCGVIQARDNPTMSASVQLVMRLPKLRHLTEDEAAQRLGITLEQLAEANSFARVCFHDPDPEPPRRTLTEAEREAARERLPKKMAERQRKAEMDARKR